MGPHADIVSTQRKGFASYISKTGYANGMFWDGRFVCGVGLSCVVPHLPVHGRGVPWGLSRCAGVVCPGMGFAKCPRVACAWVWDSPRASCMPRRVHPGVFAVVSGYTEREGARVVSPPFQGLGAAACYSPTPFQVQYHRRARS